MASKTYHITFGCTELSYSKSLEITIPDVTGWESLCDKIMTGIVNAMYRVVTVSNAKQWIEQLIAWLQ